MKRILFVSSSDRLAAPVLELLRSSGHDASFVRTPHEANEWLREERPDILIVDHDPLTADRTGVSPLLAVQQRWRAQGEPHLLVLARAGDSQHVRALFEQLRLTNFLAVSEEERVDPTELSVTVEKILGRDIFGIEQYLGGAASEFSVKVSRSAVKADVIEQAEAFAREAGCHPRIAEQVGSAVDELLSNAVYNAPTDEHGRRRYAHYPRHIPIELAPDEPVTLRLASDGHRLCISARDPFGSLEPGCAIDYLVKCLGKGANQIDSKAGGAGLGLFYLFNVFNSFILNISPGRATEVVGLVEITRSFRQHAGRRKSFNIFVAEDAHGLQAR